ncbi:P-type ATPase, cytoplasmic domain N [Pseudocohnilembus persalinus]|uniref:P-type ATPase, cytoplasmic domain N n=1 Tax=Pseudocohnilembus persalinus TaxID=266149 RepID=A0A0V0Q9T1_PSEPJ|nr:P-type ATPase, cytoplasmic domain N [Pseudocohnilembus persalinus]|eukprot:KRW98985.1 P-type ATPase, cytoplasmic domain N [Pseudocohnilembus persalinus]
MVESQFMWRSTPHHQIGAMLVASIATYIFTYISEKKILQKSKKVIKVKRFFLDEQNQIQQETVDSDQLVPNDIIEIEPGTVLTCDLVIIQGEAFVNEANITGESDPVPKVQLQNTEKPLNFEQDSASIIYEGTSIITCQKNKSQKKYQQQKVLGNVIRTAFSTKKGQVIRCTLFPVAKLQEFQRSFIKFTLFLMALGLFAQFFMLFFWFQNQKIPQKFPFIKLGETIITFGAPSASILFVFSQVAALIRLLNKNIQGNNPNAIYACGTVQTVCFDKTGTITENFVALNDVWSCQNQFLNLKNNNQQNQQIQKQTDVAQSQNKDQKNQIQMNFEQSQNQDQKNQEEKYLQDIEINSEFKNQLKKKWDYNQQIQALFACCHQIQQVVENGINQIQGDQTDIQMFKYSQYKFQEQCNITTNMIKQIFHNKLNFPIILENKCNSGEKIRDNSQTNIQQFDSIIKIQNQFDSQQYFQILKRFEFKSIFASMSVLVQNQNQEQFIFCKGSPEKLKQISLKSSIPQDFDHILNRLSLKGYRIIGLGYKKIDNQFKNQQQIENYEREHAETDLEFLGFLILENQLKPDSKQQFDRLKQSNLNLKILSGDNSLTVIHTASQVEILNKKQKIFEINFDQEQNLFQIKEILQEQIINHQFNNLEQQQEQQLLQQQKQQQQQQYIQIAINGSFLQYYQNYTNKTKNQDQIHSQQTYKQVQNIFNNLIKKTTVYSRCTPDLKQLVIQILKKQGEKVAMIGDGANDCLAINEATVGISFASAEAALSSPFCTNENSIKCVELISLILILGFLFNLQKQDFFNEKNYLEEKNELNKGGYINTQQFYIVSLLLSLKLLYLFVAFPVKKPIYRQYPLFFCQIVFLTWVILIFFLDYNFFSKFYLVKIPQSYRVKIFAWTLVTGLPQNSIFSYFNNKKLENQIIELDEQIIKNQYEGPQKLIEMVDQIIKLRKQYFQTDKYENYQRDLLQKASLTLELKNEKQAEKIYQQIIDETPEEKDTDIYMKSEALIGITRTNEDKYTYDRQLEIVEKTKKLLGKTELGPKSEYMAMCYNFESETYIRMGQYQQALDGLEQCSKIYDYLIESSQTDDEKKDFMTRQSFIYEQLGNFHCDVRNFEIGLDFLHKAKDRWDQLDPECNNQFHIRLISNIGIAYSTQGDMKQGVPYLNYAKEKLQPVTQENVEMYIFTCQHIARLQLNLGQIEESRKITDVSWEYCQKFKISPDMKLQILEHFANLYMHQDKYEEAVKYLEKGYEIVEKHKYQKVPITLRLYFLEGIAQLKFKNYQKAKECGEKVKALAEEIFGYEDEQVADGLSLIGQALYMGNKDNNQQVKIQGINYIKECIRIIEDNPSRLRDLEKYLVDLSEIYQMENQYRDAIIQAEKLRRARFRIIEQNYLNPSDIKTLKEEVDISIDQYIEFLNKKQKEFQEKGK